MPGSLATARNTSTDCSSTSVANTPVMPVMLTPNGARAAAITEG